MTVFAATCLVAHPITGWNSNSRLDLVFAAVDHGTLKIDRYQNTPPYNTGDKAYYGGHDYSDKVFGVSVLALPAYVVIADVSHVFDLKPSFQLIQYLLTRIAVALPAAVAVMLLARLLMQLGALPRRAVLATAGAYFGSMMFGYSAVFFPYLPGIALCLGALTLVLSPPLNYNKAAAIGGLLGAALIFDLTFNISVAIIGVFLLARLWRVAKEAAGRALRLMGATAAAAAIPIGAFVFYSVSIFGSPTIPYKYEASSYFREGMAKGIMGVTAPKVNAMWFLSFHAYRGIFFWSPWLLMAIVCSVYLIRKDRGLRSIAIASLVCLVGYFLFNSGYYEWWGGASMGPRLMLPMYAVVPLALVAVCRPNAPRSLMIGVTATMAASVALCLPVSLVEPQISAANPNDLLRRIQPGDPMRVKQIEVLQDFYRLRWSDIKHEWFFPITFSFIACMAVIAGGTLLAYISARRAELASASDADFESEFEPEFGSDTALAMS